ncbi:MAG: hypothetical protein ACOC1D_03600 [Prolixibacteraceae bacterium]
MDSEVIKNYFFEKLKAPGYDGLKEIDISLNVPVKMSFVNYALRTMISTSEGMKDFKEIVFSEVDERQFLVKVSHKMIKKRVRCLFHQIEINRHQEQELTIEFLEGIKFYEKAALNTFNTFRSGWSRFKKTFRGTGPKAIEGTKPFWKITGSYVTINIDALLKKQDLGYIVPALRIRDVSTSDKRFVIDLRIKT